MPFTIGKCKLFRIKHITLLEGETFLGNKHDIVFFEIKCTFFGRKENTISMSLVHDISVMSCAEYTNAVGKESEYRTATAVFYHRRYNNQMGNTGKVNLSYRT